MGKKDECVKVVVRCRPLNSKETNHECVVKMETKRGLIEVHNPKGTANDLPKSFTFDAVYDWDSKQVDLYDETFDPLVQSVIEGFNGTIFAYGQTGTGKTFTMQGVKEDLQLMGVIPRSFKHIFDHISRTVNKQYLVRVSYLEIYQEEIRDLLSPDQTSRLELKEKPDTGVYVKDLNAFVVKSIQEIDKVMDTGNKNRSVGATNMNEHSSRSHAIFIITIECSEDSDDGQNHIRVGKLNLVDLAGSERQAKTGATGQRLKEATKINLSLSALGNVISALVDGKSSHIPYRDSKLTRLLQDSLGGNAKTVMVANIGPASYNYDETITTLRYANRAKNIKNKPKINEDPKDALLREFQEQISELRAQLANKGGGRRRRKKRGAGAGADGVDDDDDDDDDEVSDGGGDGGVAQRLKKEEAQLEEERRNLQNNETLLQEEKQRLREELLQHERRLANERQQQEESEKKLKALESKLLSGGNIVDQTNEQERALQNQRRKIAEEKMHQREMQQKLEVEEETWLELQETYTSLQQEIDVKTKKLKKVYNKLQQTQQELIDSKEDHFRQREELESNVNQLVREMKLKALIIDNFIPPAEQKKLRERAVFDEDEDQWSLRPLRGGRPVQDDDHSGDDDEAADRDTPKRQMLKRPASAHNFRRPICEFSRKQAVLTGKIRFKGENIIFLQLVMPQRTTRDYQGPQVNPQLQAAVEAALQEGQEYIDIDASSFRMNSLRSSGLSSRLDRSSAGFGSSTGRETATVGPTEKRKAKKQSKRAAAAAAAAAVGAPINAASADSRQMFPQSRGLVPKF